MLKSSLVFTLCLLFLLGCCQAGIWSAESNCTAALDCRSCVGLDSSCAWCASEERCVAANTSECVFHEWQHCCNTYITCETCAEATITYKENCGWCMGQGCYHGTSLGPDEINCTDWGWEQCASPPVLASFSWTQLLLGISAAVLALVTIIGIVAAALYLRHEMSKEAARSAYNARILSMRKRTHCQHCKDVLAEYFCEGCGRKLCESCRLLLHTRGSLRANHTPVPLLPEGGGADGYASLAPLIAASGTTGGRLRSFAPEYGSHKQEHGQSSPDNLMESISPPARYRKGSFPVLEERAHYEPAPFGEANDSNNTLIAAHEIPSAPIITLGNPAAPNALAASRSFEHGASPLSDDSPPPPFLASKSLKDVVE